MNTQLESKHHTFGAIAAAPGAFDTPPVQSGMTHTSRRDQAISLLRIQRFCINDGPGIRTTVFLKGCPLACRWCHNPESISKATVLMYNDRLCTRCGLCEKQCRQGVHEVRDGVHRVDFTRCIGCGECIKVCMAEAVSLHGRSATVDEVMASVLKDVDYYAATGGGVTLSGGEPLLQPESAVAIAQACRESSIPVYLDTSGFAPASTFDKVAAAVDGFLFDMKVADAVRHREYIGVDNAPILANFRRAVDSNKPVRLRMVVVPGVTDGEENIAGTIGLAAECGFKGPVDLLPYHGMAAGKYRNMGRVYPMEGTEPPSQETLARVRARFEQAGFVTTIQ
jgi:pyruvate formate lyase activating enzyme